MLLAIAPGAAVDWPALEALLEAIVLAGELAATMQDAGANEYLDDLGPALISIIGRGDRLRMLARSHT